MSSSSHEYVRVHDIVGNKKAVPPIPGILPISASLWWKWVAAHIAPAPIRVGRTTMWRRSDVITMIERIAEKEAA